MVNKKKIYINKRPIIYNIEELKKKYKKDKDLQFINMLFKELNKKLIKYNRNSEFNQQLMIEEIYDFIMLYFIEKRIYDKEYISLKLIDINNQVNKHLRKIKKKKHKYDKKETRFWIKISKKNKSLVKIIKLNKNVEQSNNYKTINNIIFKIKDINLINEVIKKIPNLLMEKDKSKNSIINNCIDKYLTLLLSDKLNIKDILYYEAVIDIFLNNKKIKLDINIQNKISLSINKIQRKLLLNNKELKQRLIYLNHLLKKINHEQNYVENIEELNLKYFNVITNNNEFKKLEQYFNKNTHKYHDFTKKEVYTIDQTGAFKKDDAISLEKINNNYLLGIYITDVSNNVPFIHNVDNFYENDAFLYCSNKNTPILNKYLAMKDYTLSTNNIDKTIASFYEIEPNGNIKNHFYTRGHIKIKKSNCLSFEAANNIIKNKSNNKISSLFNLTQSGIINDLNSEEIIKNNYNKALNLVHKYMILENHYAALYAKNEGFPFMYLNQQNTQDYDLINETVNYNNKKKIKKIIINNLSKPYYSSKLTEHAGLGLSAYAHTTSPLRRCSDLFNQRLIKLFFIDKNRDNKVITQAEKMIEDMSEIINNNDIYAKKYLNDYAHIFKKSK